MTREVWHVMEDFEPQEGKAFPWGRWIWTGHSWAWNEKEEATRVLNERKAQFPEMKIRLRPYTREEDEY